MDAPRFDALTRFLARARTRRSALWLASAAVAAVAADRVEGVAARGRDRRRCRSGKTRCGHACVDLATDANHCGQCDVACADGETCLEGDCVVGGEPCVVAGRAALCAICHVCRDGACAPAPDGTPCGSGQTCLAGVCGPVRDPAPCPTDGPSGIAGEVVIGPSCPVERPDQPCPDWLRPFAAALRIEDASGRLFCTSRSGDDGAFRAAVPPGDYIVAPVDPNPGAPPFGQSVKATVEPGRFVNVTVRFDSGIR